MIWLLITGLLDGAGEVGGSPPVTPSAPPLGGGGGGRIWYQGRRRKRRLIDQPLKHLDWILDNAVSEYYADILESDASKAEKAAAAKIVKPFADQDKKLRLAPKPEVVNWTALAADAIQARKLLELWVKAVRDREISDEDDELMLLH